MSQNRFEAVQIPRKFSIWWKRRESSSADQKPPIFQRFSEIFPSFGFQPTEPKGLRQLRQLLLERLVCCFSDLVVHGHPSESLPGLLSVGFPGVNGDEFLFALQDVAISQGAACTSGEAPVQSPAASRQSISQRAPNQADVSLDGAQGRAG